MSAMATVAVACSPRKKITEAKRQDEEVSAVLSTHQHFDHDAVDCCEKSSPAARILPGPFAEAPELVAGERLDLGFD